MPKVISLVPPHLNSLELNTDKLTVIQLGWGFKGKWRSLKPIVHVFNKLDVRLDVLTSEKVSSQGIKVTSILDHLHEIELNMSKLPSYVNSIHFSIGSEDPSFKLRDLENIYLEITQGEEISSWRLSKDLDSYSSSLNVFNFVRKDSNKWFGEFLFTSLPSSYLRLIGILDRKSLYEEPEIEMSQFNKIKVNLLNRLINVFN